MNCHNPLARDRDGNVLMPCQAQERLIDKLRAENAALRKRCEILQGMVDYHRKAKRPLTARDRAERVFAGGG